MRLIDADTLPRHGNIGGLVHWKDIAEAPTIEVETARRGYWKVWYHGGTSFSYTCSFCGMHTPNEATPYCAYCGAQMEV